MTDAPKPLSEEQLESLLGLLRHWDGRPFGRDEREEVVARVTSLVAEVRRQRAEVARLKAKANR
jgi:hypothetical protein